MVLVCKQSGVSFRAETAKKIIDESVTERDIFISSISTREVAILVSRGRLKLTMSPDNWVAASEAIPFFDFVPVSNSIALKSV